MSYLNIPTGVPSFNKAIFSFWFRVPQDSMIAVQKKRMEDVANAGSTNIYPPLSGVIPLLTFGHQFKGFQIIEKSGGQGTYKANYWITPSGSTWQLYHTETRTYSKGSLYSKGNTFPLSPSFIGVQFDDDSKFYLHIFLQSKDFGSPSFVATRAEFFIGDQNSGYPTGAALDTVPYEYHWSYAIQAQSGGSCLNDAPAPGNPWKVYTTIKDISSLILSQDGPDSFDIGGNNLQVQPDTWHHVLFSFDLGHKTAVTGGWQSIQYPESCSVGQVGPRSYTTNIISHSFQEPCKVWLAFDDRNITGRDLTSQESPSDDEQRLGPNDILSRNSFEAWTNSGGYNYNMAWDITGVVQDYKYGFGSQIPRYSYPGASLPSANEPFGIPAASNMQNSIYRVDMAEFAMWTGIFLDPDKNLNIANEDIRRAFVGPKRKSDPVFKPVDTKTAAKLLERPPLILLHGSKNWIAGKNTGTLKNQDGGHQDFEPIHVIQPYKPNPSIRPAA